MWRPLFPNVAAERSGGEFGKTHLGPIKLDYAAHGYISKHRKLQEDLTDEMVGLARQLKENEGQGFAMRKLCFESSKFITVTVFCTVILPFEYFFGVRGQESCRANLCGMDYGSARGLGLKIEVQGESDTDSVYTTHWLKSCTGVYNVLYLLVLQDDGRDSITGFKGLSYCPGIAATHTAQGHLQCTYGRRAIVFRHEQYRERSSTDQLPKHRKILDRLCYRRMGTHRSLHQVVSCLDDAMRVREEMNDNGLKARIAKEVEAINNLSEYVAQLRRISKGHAYTISSEPLGMNVPTPSVKAVSTYGFMYIGGRSVGDTIYKYMPCACRFSPEYVHDCLSISTEDKELVITDCIAASMYLS
ncbi:vesicle transport protein, Use1 [Tanacetum coccineum]